MHAQPFFAFLKLPAPTSQPCARPTPQRPPPGLSLPLISSFSSLARLFAPPAGIRCVDEEDLEGRLGAGGLSSVAHGKAPRSAMRPAYCPAYPCPAMPCFSLSLSNLIQAQCMPNPCLILWTDQPCAQPTPQRPPPGKGLLLSFPPSSPPPSSPSSFSRPHF